MATKTSSEDLLSLFLEQATEPEISLRRSHMALAAVKEVIQSKSPDERLIQLQRISQFSNILSEEVLRSLAAEVLQDKDPRIRGETCYALGRSGNPSFITDLQLLLTDESDPWVQRQAQEAIQILQKTTSEFDSEELLARVEKLTKAEGDLISKKVTKALDQLSKAKPDDVQNVAGSQIRLIDNYHDTALEQAQKSFRLASIVAFIGIIFFLGTIAFLLVAETKEPATIGITAIGIIGGAIVEVISGIIFFLYGKATAQLAHFHQSLDQTRRFLLANSICESLEGETKQKSRAGLVMVVATLKLEQTESVTTD